MKDEKRYKIGEISKVYGIGVDSLRYYEEIGILNPQRDTNNYRMYSVEDIRTLNILRELRSLGFSFEDIKKHLVDFDLDDTIALFKNEIEIINHKIKKMETLKLALHERINGIENVRNIKLSKTPMIESLEERLIIHFSESLYQDEEVDFVLKNIQNTDEKLYMIGRNESGAIIPLRDIRDGDYGNFNSVFFVTDQEVYNKTIPKGKYLTMAVYGSYEQLPEAWESFFDYINDNELEVLSDPMELYLVDNHTSSHVEEYVTQLQVLIK